MQGTLDEIRVIFAEEFRRQLKRVGWRIFTFAVPVLLLLALIIVPLVRNAIGGDGPAAVARLGYVDDAGVMSSLADTPGLVRFTNTGAGISALTAGDVDALFAIPGDYLESGEVEWYRHGGGVFSGEDMGARFTELLRLALVADQVDAHTLARVVNTASYETFRVDEDGTVANERSPAEQVGDFFVPFIFAILLMISIFTGSGSLLQSISEEKENRMVEMLITSVQPISIMAGKVLALGAAGLLQVTVWIASAALIAPRIVDQIPNAGDLQVGPALLLTVIAFFIAGYFLFAVIMAGMGAATTSVREASQVSALVTLPAVVPVWLSSLIITDPDGPVARVLTFIPLTAPTAVMLRIAAGDPAPAEVAGSLLLTLATALALLWVSARIFRAGILLYGQRMSLRRVWLALRTAA